MSRAADIGFSLFERAQERTLICPSSDDAFIGASGAATASRFSKRC
jgi:hypothetical protein